MSTQLVWLITGTSSGFGHVLAQAALRRGDKVIATARAQSLGRIRDLQHLGADALALDVTSDPAALALVAERALALHGRVDVVVNNAGCFHMGTVEETTHEEAVALFNINVFGAINVARAFLPAMRARGTGTIVWIGSQASWLDPPVTGFYGASKAAMRSFARTLHTEIAPFGLRSFVVEPGAFHTDILEKRPPYEHRIAAYRPLVDVVEGFVNGLIGNQKGDTEKGCEVIVDLVRGDGVAAGAEVPTVVALGSDCVESTIATLKGSLALAEKWAPISSSTDVHS
ncbi:NAD(P)-binding protein [Artomyces pyxidatus]|uniref:NAD(P)-binding protein n=1 Tax=Artomyces pyxidatus TaxID=48021 RepID=A0ACB8SK68_9AGAM|nr:NAD(P)-binding protein [Artomyces pyxidatus]